MGLIRRGACLPRSSKSGNRKRAAPSKAVNIAAEWRLGSGSPPSAPDDSSLLLCQRARAAYDRWLEDKQLPTPVHSYAHVYYESLALLFILIKDMPAE
jgi:hypothetical protein